MWGDSVSLQVGAIVRHDNRLWRVGLVNQSRARLDPVQGTIHKLLSAEFMSYGASVNVSPGSPLEEVTDKQLSQAEHRRAEKLAERVESSFIVKDAQSSAKGEAEMETGTATAVVGQPEGAQSNVSKVAAAKAKVAAKKAKAAKAKPNGAAVAQPTVSTNKKANQERLAALKAKQTDKKAAKAAAPKKEKAVRPCGCGCGEQVTSFFAQGHDARFKGWMIKVERGTMAVKDLPPLVQKSYEFKKKAGSDGGYVTTKDYKGEVHKGYDKAEA